MILIFFSEILRVHYNELLCRSIPTDMEFMFFILQVEPQTGSSVIRVIVGTNGEASAAIV